MNKTLHLKTLIDKEACSVQSKLFKKLFGESVKLTEALVLEHCSMIDMDWAISNLLSPESCAEYWKIEGAAWTEYHKTCALAFFNLYDGDNIPG